jgi:hypothetical protein
LGIILRRPLSGARCGGAAGVAGNVSLSVVVDEVADIPGGFGPKIWRHRKIAEKSQSIRDCSEFARFYALTVAMAVHSALTTHSS